MKKNIKILFVFSVLFISIWACKKSEMTPGMTDSGYSEEDLQLFLTDIYNNEIKVVNAQMLVEIEKLESEYSKFENDPTISNNELVKDQWKQTALIINKCKVFNIATIDRQFYFNELYTFPTSQDLIAGIDTNYKKSVDIIDVSSFSASHKGLGVLEYLFFEEDSLVNYNALVHGVIVDMKNVNGELIDKWTEIEDDFVSGKDITINNGYGELVNSFVSLVEVSKKNRFDLPFGIGGTGNYNFEAEYSQFSADLFSSSFSYLNYVFKTYYVSLLQKGGQESLSNEIEQVLDLLDQDLNQLVETNGQNTFETIDADSQETNLERVQNDITDFLQLIKIDLSTLYDTLVTFSPADGD